jgi:GR25 family glycosyltransferase involved in LPS biosynthesis
MNYYCYIITLLESSERVENVKKLEIKLKARGYHVEIIPAYYYKSVDIYHLMDRENITYKNTDGTLVLTQIGCFLSHREVWKKIQAHSENDVHIIIEDDMNLDNNVDLYDFNKIPEYDAVILWRHPSQLNTPVTHAQDGLLHQYFQWGMCAYAVRPSFAKELLDIQQIDVPIDLLLYRDVYPHKRVFVTEHSPFINLGYLGVPSEYQYKSWIYT